ncbi:MAG: DUF2231 domain-containing protein [Acidimicrobiales bacterium]
MESFNGLPAHPLFIHAPVMLVPLTTLLTLVFVVRPMWRRRAWYALPGAAALCIGTTQLAIMSGEAFDEIAGDAIDTSTHETLALWTRAFLVLFFVASLVLAVLDRRLATGSGPGWAGSGVLIMVAVTTILSILASVWMFRTGDEGARLVWDGVLTGLLFG